MIPETIEGNATLSNASREARVLFLGMGGAASLPPLLALLDAGVPIVGVLLPGERGSPLVPLSAPAAPPPGDLPLLTPFVERTIVTEAWARQIPVWAAGALDAPATLAGLRALQPDAIAVACFSLRIPPPLLALPPLGCLNIHPSRLPEGRGPAPLFWALRAGLRETAVTVHLMDEGLDSGPIVAQAPLPIPPGIAGEALEQRAMALGGALLVAALRGLAAGTLTPQPQPPGGHSQPTPTPTDCTITPAWSAAHAANFIVGAAPWAPGFWIEIGGRAYPIAALLGHDATATLDAPRHRDGAELWVQMTPGLLHLLLAPTLG